MEAYQVVVQQEQVAVAAGGVAQVETAVRTALAHENCPPAEVGVVLVDNDRIKALNHQFRGIDRPTDVLSFPADEAMPADEAGRRYLGDIIIALPVAEQQAAAAGHGLAAELQLLAIHGTLHLLGHDHSTASEKARMWGAQTAVLAQLGLSHISPTETDHA